MKKTSKYYYQMHKNLKYMKICKIQRIKIWEEVLKSAKGHWKTFIVYVHALVEKQV